MDGYLKMFDLPVLGKILLKCIVKKEGGNPYSKTLRKYYEKKYQIFIGAYSYGGCFDEAFNTGGKVYVGKYCSIASEVRYFGANHPMQRAVMSPFFYNKSFGFDVDDVERGILNIGNDVWIGYGTLITNKCRYIGDGAVIAAGSVVTMDVEPYSVVAGVPARKIGERFDKEIGVKLTNSKWYDRTPIELMNYYAYMKSPLLFAEKLLEEERRVYERVDTEI